MSSASQGNEITTIESDGMIWKRVPGRVAIWYAYPGGKGSYIYHMPFTRGRTRWLANREDRATASGHADTEQEARTAAAAAWSQMSGAAQ